MCGQTFLVKDKWDGYFNMKVPNFWWVNQGRTYEMERSNNLITAPRILPGERAIHHWTNIKEVKKSDIIFHYAKGYIEAISIAITGQVRDYQRPAPLYSMEDGYALDLTYFDIEPINGNNISPHLDEFNKALPKKYSLFNSSGGVNQGYLFGFTFEAAKIIRNIYGKPFPEPIEKYFPGFLSPIQSATTINEIMLLQSKKQTILYGPPGTGKTYNTKQISVDFLERKKCLT